jgi:hypothetical protein
LHSWKIIGFFSKWIKWDAPIDVSLTLPFFYFRDIVIKREEDEPLRHKPHASGYLYLRHSSDIFRSFIVYFLWVERCHLHFVKIYSNHKVLQHVWPPSKTNLRDSIESSFIYEWLDINGIILTSSWWMMTMIFWSLSLFFLRVCNSLWMKFILPHRTSKALSFRALHGPCFELCDSYYDIMHKTKIKVLHLIFKIPTNNHKEVGAYFLAHETNMLVIYLFLTSFVLSLNLC